MLVNTTSANTSIPYTSSAIIQTEGTYSTASISITNTEANGNTSALMLCKKRGASGSVNSGDTAGSVGWGAYDGGSWRTLGLISAKLTAAGSNNVPTDLVFNANSGSSNGERFRIRGGGGITFNGDTGAGNALDDYEEGSWTPTGISATLAGQYTKIGNKVFWALQINSITGSSAFSIGGLPYTVNNGWGGGISISDNNHSPEEIYVFAHKGQSTIYFRTDQNATFNVSF